MNQCWILENDFTIEFNDGDEKVLVQEEDDEGDEKSLALKENDSNKDDEIITNTISGNKKPTLDNDEETMAENGEKDDKGHKQTRRSERIKKQRVQINPDDIGEDDNVNDKDYK